MLKSVKLSQAAKVSPKRERSPLREGEVMLAQSNDKEKPVALVLNPGVNEDKVELSGRLLKKSDAPAVLSGPVRASQPFTEANRTTFLEDNTVIVRL